jgi:hypothetical protein
MLELVIPAVRLLRPVSSLILVIFVQAMPGGHAAPKRAPGVSSFRNHLAESCGLSRTPVSAAYGA